MIWAFVSLAVSKAKSASSILDNLEEELFLVSSKKFNLWSIAFSLAPNFALVFAIVSIAVSILVKAEVAFEELDTEIIDPV